MAVLIPLAVYEAWWVTPDQDYYKQMDFAMYYTGGRMFDLGMNPYDRTRAEDVWTDEHGANGDYQIMDFVLGPNPYDPTDPGGHWLPINLIPPALTVTAPIALLPVKYAWPLWNTIVGLLLAGQVFAISRLMNKPLWHWTTLTVILITALLDPLHIGLANGQPAVPAISLIILALWLARIDWQIMAGIALAISTALKPQLAAPFAIYLLWQGNYKTVVAAGIAGVTLTLVAIVPLQLHGYHWATSWLSEVRFAERAGGINDARRSNTGRQDMVQLQLLIHFFSDSALIVNILSAGIILCLGAMLLLKSEKIKSDLAPLAAFAVLALLPVYHRMYDTGILMLPIAWAVCNLIGKWRWYARVMLLIIGDFFFTQAWYEARFLAMDARPGVPDSWWFNLFLEPHNPLALLSIFICIYAAISQGKIGFPVRRITTEKLTAVR